MHELSLLQDLFRKIEDIAKQEQADTVTKVHVKLGALAHISPEHFTEHFNQMRNLPLIANAQLEITQSTDEQDPHAQEIQLISIDIPE